MTRDEAIKALKAIEPQSRAMSVTGLYLYGSTARGEQRADSDLFVDYDTTSRFDILDLIDIKWLAERSTGGPVDLTTSHGLHPLLKPKVERDAVRVF